MKCPVDNETLLMTQRDGVEIDYCPKCRGVWLDRGELDKIIEKSVSSATPPVQLTPPPEAAPQPTAFSQPSAPPQYQAQPQYQERREPRYEERREQRHDDRGHYDDRRRYDDDDDYKYRGKRKKRDSFLSDLFDF